MRRDAGFFCLAALLLMRISDAAAQPITLEQAAIAVQRSHNNPALTANKLCLVVPKSFPQLTVVGTRSDERSPCTATTDVLVTQGGLRSVGLGGFSWPEPAIADAWRAASPDERTRLALRYVLEVSWAFRPVLAVSVPDFDRKHAPPFAAPSVRIDGPRLHVEAWHRAEVALGDARCYQRVRFSIEGGSWSEASGLEVFCTAGGVVEIQRGGRVWRDGKPLRGANTE